MLEVIVCEGNHQGYDNGEDDCKGHGNIRWNDQEVREAIFIDSFDHFFKVSATGIPLLMCLAVVCASLILRNKEYINNYKD